VAIVAAGGDLVAEADAFAGGGGECSGGDGLAGGEAVVTDRGVQRLDLLAGVGDDSAAGGLKAAECGEAFDLGGVDGDPAVCEEPSKTSPARSLVRMSSVSSAYSGSVKRWTIG